MNRAQKIEQLLTDALAPESIDLLDESHKHAGHAGAKGGAGHYDLTIVSSQFCGQNTMARHRMVYAVVGDMMPTEIHALSIKAFAPDEI
ncbi:MAG: BolA protein [Saprospiraceae bacterium]